MISTRQRATVLIAVFMAIFTVATPAVQAQTKSVVTEWSNPGSFPFKGNFSDVCSLYEEELSEEQCARALLAFENDSCDVFYLQEGDVIDVSFTSETHHRKVLQVTFGDEVSVDDSMRRAYACDTGRSDGLKLVRPDVCGNWSLMTFRNVLPQVIEVTKPKTASAFICRNIPAHTHKENKIFFVPSVNIGDVCTSSHIIPGFLYQDSGVLVSGVKTECVDNFDENFQ